MPLTKLQFKPGVVKDTTAYSNEGGWVDSEGNVGTASQDGGDQETLTLYQSPSVLGLLCATSTSGQNLHFYKIKVDAEI